MYYYIINPAAGAGKINKIQDKLKSLLSELDIIGEFVKTTGIGDATKLTKLALAKGYTTVVAVGGDNTVNEVMNGILDEKAALGVIPTGSTNSLAKTLGINSWEEACSILAARKLETIDLGKINNRYFITSATLGFETKIIKYRTENGFWPKLSFAKKILSELKSFKPKEVTLELGDELVASTEMFTVIVANSKPLSGFKKIFTPNPQDGYLDILIVSHLPKTKILKQITSIVKGAYENLPETSTFRAKNLVIKTKESLPISIDGEDVLETPVKIEVVPKKLKVIVGKKRQF